MYPPLETLLAEGVERKASDIHLTAGQPPVFRVNGALVRRPDTPPLDAAAVETLVLPVLSEMGRATLMEGGGSAAEAVLTLPDSGRTFFLLALRAHGGLTATIRIVLQEVPVLDKIGGDTTDLLKQMATTPRGLVLITGPTGSGKMTTAAAIVEHSNQDSAARIFVLEEVPGYVFSDKQGVVTTLRIGQDFESYERAASLLMRGADPDVVLFSDLPTLDAVRQALVLADTGHLVIGVLAAEGAAQAVEDLMNAFPEPRDGVRALLARTLVAVFNQRLIVRASGQGRVAAYEALMGSPTLRERIRNGASASELHAVMEADGGGSGQHRTLDGALDALVERGEITPEQADLHRTDRARSAAFTPALAAK
jgi:twitching motility protein PilT